MKKLKGFTLIELIVVIAIIGILSALLIPSWMNYIANSRLKTQNENSRIVFNASQTIVQDYKFAERILEDDEKNIGSGDFYFYWNDNTGTIVDATTGATVATPDTAFGSKLARKINKVFSDSDQTTYKIHVNNYIVKSVVSGRRDDDYYIGSYPDKQDERQDGVSILTYDMSSVE